MVQHGRSTRTVPRHVLQPLVLLTLLAGAIGVTASSQQPADRPMEVAPWPREAENPGWLKPKAPPQAWLGLIGEYGPEREPVYIAERGGHLWAIISRGQPSQLDEASLARIFNRDGRGRAIGVTVAGVAYQRRQVGPAEGSGQLRVEPLRPVADVLKESMTAEPPRETGDFREADLVELVKMDPTIKLEIRYATTNNFLGSVFYAQARAFMQRPAAEAVVRANQVLKKSGYGLLIHDGYRPWYVTKTFWDATPLEKKWLVADPSSGSRHNRGCAIDLTLYDLETGRAVEMPSTYDESTLRAYAFYPGGSELQHWHRALLRRAMEAEGFTVNPNEWWHFDHKDWKNYRIGNVAFDKIMS
jgi:D-alanyl-D-alanine dipeptidase